jgi:predicted dehydrogenase
MAHKPLRAILVGCGGICGAWLPHIVKNPGVKIVALVDLNPESAQRRAREYELDDVLLATSLEGALSIKDADVVFDCTVPAAHHDVTMIALRHGCHVLGEKPLADSMEHARAMVAEAQRAQRIYAVIQNRRYNAGIRRLRAFLESGALGRITTACCDFFIGIHVSGFRQQMEHVLLLDMAIHTFDAARFLLGGARARTALCHEWNPPGSGLGHGAAAEAIFEMAGDATFIYRGSWCAEGLHTSWEGSWRIIGEKGSVLWDGKEGFRAEVPEQAESFTWPQRALEVPPAEFPAQSSGHESIIAEFIAAVQNGTAPETVCTDNILSLAMVFSAIESAARGARVNVDALFS